jgi:hypothetical protein
MNDSSFEAAKTRAIQQLAPRPGVLRSGMNVATLAQVRQIMTRADMNAILEGPNIPGEPFKKPAAQKIKDELNAAVATGGRRRSHRRRMQRRRTYRRR